MRTLWEIHRYTNGMLIFNEVKSPLSKEPVAAIAKNSAVARKLARGVYTEDDHLLNGFLSNFTLPVLVRLAFSISVGFIKAK
jgi:hypothetical protein